MGNVRLSEHINAPINQVWDLNASCERVPEWNVNIVEVRDCQGRLDRVGAKTTTVGRIFGRKIEGSSETTKADKPNAFGQKFSGAGGARGTVNITYAEARGGTIFPGNSAMGELLAGSIERDLRHSMENFKALCEAPVPAHV